jgi:hypothetical protein
MRFVLIQIQYARHQGNHNQPAAKPGKAAKDSGSDPDYETNDIYFQLSYLR